MLVPEVQVAVATIGGITALMAALIALTQNDLKRVLAYSTDQPVGLHVHGAGQRGGRAGICRGGRHGGHLSHVHPRVFQGAALSCRPAT